MSLANKYRPNNFDDVVEQHHITDILKAHSSQDRSHSNYLFFGPRGTGKTSCARILAKGLNCENIQNGNPCNQCDSCLVINNGKSLDIVEIDAASHTGVDNIRSEIIDKAGYSPTQLKMKVYIIDEVHMLSKGAFNALLKIMEEPGETIRFILATTEIHKVIDTIVSRCQVFNFKRISNKAVIERLKNIADKESLSITEDALDIIAQMSEGCMRDAIKYLDQVSILGDINEENVTQFLGVASTSAIEKFMETLINAKQSKNYEEAFAYIAKVNENGIDLINFAKQILTYIDQNLISNIEVMSELSNLFTDIMMNNKRYPQPLLLYKTKIYEYINGASVGNNTIKAGAQYINPMQTNKSKQEDKQANKKEIVKTNKDISSSEEVKNEEKDGLENGSDLHKDLKKLHKAFVDSIDKVSLKSMFDDQSNILSIHANIVEIVVINPMAKMQVSKKETLEYLEGIMSKLLQKPYVINFVFKSKEDFMQDQLFSQ